MRFSLIRLSPRQSTSRIPLTPPGLATGPSAREAPRPRRVLAVAVAHLAKGPSLRRVMLSTPIIATTPFSDFRSALRHFTGLPLIGFAAARHPGRHPGPSCWRRDGPLLFHDGLCERSAPLAPAGP